MYGDGELEVSEGWRQVRDLSTTMDPNVSSTAQDDEHFCKLILYQEIKESTVRIWDVIILIPNLLFLLFIIVRCNRARLKLRATSSPIYLAFYGLVICSVVISVIRCVVSMTVNATGTVGGIADKVFWVTVRFFLLSTEMSVVIFCLAFGHLDSRSSIRRVLLATSFIALIFTITQGTLELILPDDTFHIPSRDFYVFGHGGMMFWFCSSIVFTMIYVLILILPYTRLRERLALPSRKSFYVYAGLLATLDLVQSIGAGLLNYTQNPAGLCVVDLTAAMYLTFFTPLVYHTFLSEFFGVSQPSIMFSYKAQVDDAMEEDTVSLPHQQSFSSLKTDSDYIYQNHSVYDSTQFDVNSTPVNPLYAASLQSPDSITGYSIDSEIQHREMKEQQQQQMKEQPNGNYQQ
ncbi:transmembrane protein adipocyte-associated 1 homolog isoform X2 [Phymastichus coffea]|uniref:transmembrane protein adipocyte-associated 1 homolog isoform X2 n=1 Tax=Phymastichus coffea TaxID=108790 RepID=UPI00273BE7EA|nr:transmembrane protein adipocyte-associated 1 homolog isoform X2 [Phymastichus coffea]